MGNVDLHRKFESLQQELRTTPSAPSDQSAPLATRLREAVDTLEVALERLKIAEEKLQQQTEALAMIRQNAAVERQQLETRLQKNETRFQLLLESVNQYAYRVRVEQGRPVSVRHNPGCVTITGYTPQEYDNNPALWDQIIHQEDRSTVEAHLAKILAGQTIGILEHRLIHKDGAVRWVKHIWISHYDDQGQLVAYDGLMADVTHRNQVEEQLRESEERYHRLVDVSFDGVIIHIDGKIVWANSSAAKLYGTDSPQDLCGRSLFDFTYPDDEAVVRQRVKETYQKRRSTTLLEQRLIRLDGTVIDVEVAATPTYYQGQPAAIFVVRDISRRKRVELALRESELKFRTLAEMTTAAIFIYQGVRLRSVNPATEQMTGYPEAELLAMDFLDIVHPDFRALVGERREKRQRHEPVPARTEIKILTKQGEVRWIDITAGAIEFEGEVAVIGTAFDITRAKEAELERERLLADERRQRLSAETLGEIYLVLTAQVSYEAVLDEILDQVQNLVPYRAANLVLLDGYNLRPARWQGYESSGSTIPTQSLIDLPLDRKAVQTRQPVLVSDTRQDPDWAVRPGTAWVRSFMTIPIFLRDQVLGLLRLESDIPDRFSAEDVQTLVPLANATALALENARLYDQARREIEERKQVEKKLRQTVTRTHTIVDAIRDSLLFLSPEGQLIDCRVTDERLIILKPTGAPDDAVPLEERLPPDLLHQIRTHLATVSSPPASLVFEYQLQSPLARQDYEVQLVVSSLNEVMVIVRNITKRKRAEQETARTERLAALGKLAAALAHEINNPLQIIQSNLDLILDRSSEMADNEHYLAVIHSQIKRLSNLADEVLNLSRPRSSLRQSVDLVELVQEVLDLTQNFLEQHHVQLSFEAQPVPPVAAVAHQLSQVFLNLVINAVEAIPGQGRLQVAIYPLNQEVAISFTSDGLAIPPDILPRIFDPFFTTKAKGTGLGLWICHNLIEQNQGSLTAHNVTEPQGVVFTVKLPLVLPG